MKERTGIFSGGSFVLIIVLFLTPFVTVSCMGMFTVPVSGMDLALGTTVEYKEPFSGNVQRGEIGAEPLAGIVLGLAVFGLLMSFVYRRAARIAGAAAGAGGGALLLLLKYKFDQAVVAKGGGIITVNYEAGFWWTLLILFAAAVLNLYLFQRSRRADEP